MFTLSWHNIPAFAVWSTCHRLSQRGFSPLPSMSYDTRAIYALHYDYAVLDYSDIKFRRQEARNLQRRPAHPPSLDHCAYWLPFLPCSINILAACTNISSALTKPCCTMTFVISMQRLPCTSECAPPSHSYAKPRRPTVRVV